jgi:hypothetical protein
MKNIPVEFTPRQWAAVMIALTKAKDTMGIDAPVAAAAETKLMAAYEAVRTYTDGETNDV